MAVTATATQRVQQVRTEQAFKLALHMQDG
jgi:hypothetical protein